MTKARVRAAKSRATPAKRPKPASRTRHSDDQVRWLLHELQVQSEEITVQNEQLIKAQSEIELARDRYAELYDFAPVGYLTLDARSTIHECNFAASAMLARPRRFLMRVPLSALVANEHRAMLRDFLQRAATQVDGSETLDVNVKAPPQRVVRLFTKARPAGAGTHLLFTAMLDVTAERQLAEDRTRALLREQVRGRDLADEVAGRTKAQARVKTLTERLVSVQEGERRRLARDLHDHLGQQLTAMRLALNVLKERSSGQDARRQIDRIEQIASALDRDVDHLAWELRPPALDEFGLGPALKSLVREWTQYHGVAATFAAPAEPARLPPDVESHLYRIVQESLTNVAKHARATRVSVALEQSGSSLQLTIHDNGVGFNPVIAQGATGMGLIGMRERTALIGGHIVIDSSDGRGTAVTVRMAFTPRGRVIRQHDKTLQPD